MATRRCSYEFEVSEPLFRLATECVRWHSNEIRQLATLGDVLDAHAGRAADGFPGQDFETLRGHLATLPTDGEYRLSFEVADSTEAVLSKTQAWLTERLDQSVSRLATVSVTLFDYSVDHTVSAMLGELLSDDPAVTRMKGPNADGEEDNVVPFRQ